MNGLAELVEAIERAPVVRPIGRVRSVSGLTITAAGLPAALGSECEIVVGPTHRVAAQVVGFREDLAILMPIAAPLGVAAGQPVRLVRASQRVAVGPHLLGRVLNARGEPIDGGPPVTTAQFQALNAAAPPAMSRRPIDAPLSVGIRAINALTTIGRGQRVGVFSGTGVGKSVLLGMMARYTSADVNLIALIGERGREVRAFIDNDLGPDGLRRSVVVVSTSDESPVLRVRAAQTATAIAEYFRECGKDVLLLVDSITRMAMAQRQIGLAAGEPPATKGYPPSVFSLMPQILERAGRTSRGSITGLYTVLVEGDDLTEPIADAARGILDGHVWLSRRLAARGHYPAVDVLESISRVMADITDAPQRDAALKVRRLLATWKEIEDLVNIGAYAAGTNAEFDLTIQMRPAIETFLRQAIDESASLEESRDALLALAGEIDRRQSGAQPARPAVGPANNRAQSRSEPVRKGVVTGQSEGGK